MPSYKTANRYQVGDYWIGQRTGSDNWHRMWFDKSTRQTRRVSLGTTDFEQAKCLLNDWFVLNRTKADAPIREVTLAEVFSRFYEQHARTLVTRGNAATSLRYWLDFHGTATIEEALKPQSQAGFRSFLMKERNLSGSSSRRVLAVGKSALNWAWKRGEIDALPYIELVKVGQPEPKGRPLELLEVATLFEKATEPHLKVFMAFMLATGGRTSAVVELKFDQIDLGNRLIHLNPNGRQQNKKHRPTVKLPEQLVEYVEQHQKQNPKGPIVAFDDKGVSSVRRTWRSTRKRSGLNGNVQTYSFRHTMARWLRKQSVPAWEVAAQLGHKSPTYSTTEIYAPYDPSHLENATKAIDRFLSELAHQLGATNISEYLSS